MEYIARVTKEGKFTLADFPDCPGCRTFAEADEDVAAMAREALEGWLKTSLENGDAIRLPKARRHAADILVPVEASLAVAVQVRSARETARLSQKQLAERAGMKQQMIARIEKAGGNPTLNTLSAVAAALGTTFAFSFAALGARFVGAQPRLANAKKVVKRPRKAHA